MQILLIPILVIIGAFLFSSSGTIFGTLNKQVKEFRLFPEPISTTKTPPETKGALQPAPKIIPAPPSLALNTSIVSGPENGSVLTDQLQVTFGFNGSSQTQNITTFQTMLEGAETIWIQTTGNTRTIVLPPGNKIYTFKTRSVFNSYADTTPDSRTFRATVSPYAGKVILSGVTKGNPSLITLGLNLKDGEQLWLTGWSIQSKAGKFTIPLGMEEIPNGLSSTNQKEIVAASQDKIYISSAKGPLGYGVNFRPNDCMGYLKQNIAFPIGVPGSCSTQKPDEYSIMYFNQTCQNYLLNSVNYSSCTPPDYSKTPNISIDKECTQYLEALAPEFTYQGCLLRKEGTLGFIKPEWHIYSNINLLTQRFDFLELRDPQGLLVDKKAY